MAKTGVNITTVTPFYINTGMFDGVKSPIVPIVPSEIAVAKIIKGIEKNKTYVRMPGLVYAIPFFKGVLPQKWFDILVGRWFRIYKTMDTFTGRL
jgi:all-trans-retinol dehydrogenase (NAD+)